MSSNRRSGHSIAQVAGNGLLDRRALLGRGVMLAGAMGAGAVGSVTGAAAEPLKDGPWSLEVGDVIPPYQTPSRFEKAVVRTRRQSQERAAQFARPHAAPSAQGHHHARTACISPSAMAACPTSTRPSTSSSSTAW